jgi:hypothetical protein
MARALEYWSVPRATTRSRLSVGAPTQVRPTMTTYPTTRAAMPIAENRTIRCSTDGLD